MSDPFLRVEVRENSPTGVPLMETVTVNKFSSGLRRAMARARHLAGHYRHGFLYVENFIDGLIFEEDTRKRLEGFGFRDDADNAARRRALFEKRRGRVEQAAGIEVEESPRLKAWLAEAEKIAGQREGEHRTITVKDLLDAVDGRRVFEKDTALDKVRKVVAGYRPNRGEAPFADQVMAFIGEVPDAFEQGKESIENKIDAVGRKVDGVGGQIIGIENKVDARAGQIVDLIGRAEAQVGVPGQPAGAVGASVVSLKDRVKGVSEKVGAFQEEMHRNRLAAKGEFESLDARASKIQGTAEDINAKVAALVSLLPAAMRLSKSTAAMALAIAAVGGACVGLMVRSQLGPL